MVRSLPFQVIECPHCRLPCRFYKARWGAEQWVLQTDFEKVSLSSANLPSIAKCPRCRSCFWRSEALTIGYLNHDGLNRTQELFGVDSVPHTDSPYATDIESAIVNGLPRFESDIWRLHLMAWRRLNDGLRFEPRGSTTTPSMDKPVRTYIAKALLEDLPNRHALTRILRIDILRQTARFRLAQKSAETMLAGLGIVKSLGEWESNRRNEIYRKFLTQQISLIARNDRLPHPYALTAFEKETYHHASKEAARRNGPNVTLRPVASTGFELWRRVERGGWTCHNCGRGGRAGEDFTYNGNVNCRHCGWPQ